jgi:CrcB protein
MKEILFVALGGAFGSVCRYSLSSLVLAQTINWRFPLGTFLVNIIGCFVIGLLSGLVIKHDYFSNEIRLLLITGVIGGFTTFSAFGLETVYLIRRDEFAVAGFYVASSVIFGLLILWLGFLLIPNKG